MPGSRLIACVAAVGVLAGCANQPAAQVSPTEASSRSSLLGQGLSPAPIDAARAATAWAATYCGWSYRVPNRQRQANAQALMTASAAAALSETPDATWDAGVVASEQTATCADITTHVVEAPRTPTMVYVLITAARTVTDRTGTVATSQFVEPRRIVLINGRWLVDARVEGG